jgi:hypothetical protein
MLKMGEYSVHGSPSPVFQSFPEKRRDEGSSRNIHNFRRDLQQRNIGGSAFTGLVSVQ